MDREPFTYDATERVITASAVLQPEVEQEILTAVKLYDPIKRGLDILLSLLGLIVLSPLFLVVALIIWIDDPKGGPFYVSTRIGKNRKPFTFYKFRSMCVDAEQKLESLMHKNEVDGPAFKIKDDPRVTKIGRFIRRTSIDELPQLLNVLKGDMSIVGPRPPIPREVMKYEDRHLARLLIRPGLTCYWQVQRNRNSVGFEKWVELDLKYIQERSFWVDVKVVVRTVGAVLGCDGI